MADRKPARGARKTGVRTGIAPSSSAGLVSAGRVSAGLEARLMAIRALAETRAGRRAVSMDGGAPPVGEPWGGEPVGEPWRGAPVGAKDLAFARMIWATCLRRSGQIERILADLCKSGAPGGISDAILAAGAAQLLFLRTPDHAALSTSVDAARHLGVSRHTGLVNAVLRRIARERTTLLDQTGASGEANTPDWIWQRWVARFGAARAEAMAKVHLNEPPLDLMPGGDGAQLPALFEHAGLASQPLPGGGLRLQGRGDIRDLPGFADGTWWVQDYAASMAVRMLGVNLRGLRFVDLCAAPGGKTMQLAAAGAEIVAVERSRTRIAMIERNLQRTGLHARIIKASALNWCPDTPIDAVLVDPPCLGVGTFRRHPDLLVLARPEQLSRLVALQRALLRKAASWLAPGGMLIYSVCSLMPEEGPDIFAGLCAADPTMRPFDPPDGSLVPDGARINPGEFLLTPDLAPAPCIEGGMDGFYIGFARRASQ